MASYAKSKDRARNNAAIYSVIAIAILIAIPATIAYADSSDSEIHKLVTNEVYVNEMRVSDGSHTVISVPDHSSMSAVLSENVVLTPGTTYQIYFDGFVFDGSIDYITFSTTLPLEWVKLLTVTAHTASLHIGAFIYNELTDSYRIDIPLMYLVNPDEKSFRFDIRVSEEVELSGFEYSVKGYSSEDVFTSEVVESIALVSGLMLIVFALFATPWISVSQVTRTARKGARSVKNGAKKATRSVKRSVKKTTRRK